MQKFHIVPAWFADQTTTKLYVIWLDENRDVSFILATDWLKIRAPA